MSAKYKYISPEISFLLNDKPILSLPIQVQEPGRTLDRSTPIHRVAKPDEPGGRPGLRPGGPAPPLGLRQKVLGGQQQQQQQQQLWRGPAAAATANDCSLQVN